MKKLAMLLLLMLSASALAATTTVRGYLVDLSCAADLGDKPGFGQNHKKSCLQMPDCKDSGYGVLTGNKKVVKFDKAGNEKARKFIAASDKAQNFRVTVTGTVKGDTMTVNKIELQPSR